LTLLAPPALAQSGAASQIGREVSVPRHLQDGEEFQVPLRRLIEHGQSLFKAVWTGQEGGGRPFTKGNGNPLSDLTQPLIFPRNFNRISTPDANSCAGCHAQPFGIAGGGGDFVSGVFVLAQRFDFLTFDRTDFVPTKGSVDELGRPVTLQTVANSRATLGMFGSGFIEMLARQMTGDFQAIRDATAPGEAHPLVSKGISFGMIVRRADGSWDTSLVEGIPATSLVTTGPANPPSLIIRPFHQAGRVVSLREFSNNAFNHHHGIQPAERFGVGTDPDGDGFVNELTRADVTAVAVFQATLSVPGRVIPNDPEVEAAVLLGEIRFQQIGCATCHVPSLPLDNKGWIFTEPNPFNPAGNLRPGEAPSLRVDLTRGDLPGPRLKRQRGVVHVPAFTDLKLHDIFSDASDPNIEPLDMQEAPGSMGFFAGNRKMITRKLWGCANEPPFFHHGQFTTLRQAVLAHDGEALASRQAFQALTAQDQDAVVEFLKTLQVLPPGTQHLICDENYRPKQWPPHPQKP
jgi:cytochrome c peroxidase